MATTLTVSGINARLNWAYSLPTSFGADSSNSSGFSYAPPNLNQGTGANKAQILYAATLTIATGATTTLDLSTSTGSGFTTDPFGVNNIFALGLVLYVRHKTPTATSTLEIAGNWFINTVLSGTTPKLKVRPGGCFLISCTDAVGYPIVDATQDILTLKNNDAASVDVDVALIGQ